MDIDLSGQVVAITGASSGIGEATALAAAQAGAAVALAARRTERIEALAARIEEGGGRAIAVTTDVSDEAQARAFVAATIERLGRLDALVNNAGVMLLGPVPGAPTDEWRRMIDANVYGVIYTTHAAVEHLIERGSGHVVTISSVAGVRASAGSAVYNLTKFGVNAFSEALRQELAEHNVRVTVVEPGAVTTELRDHLRPEIREQQAARFAGVTPLEAADVANAVVYALGQPEHVSLNEILVRPTKQQR
jgi:NADP-dependent 3-hydroxy acid dehydrogenase YdfG